MITLALRIARAHAASLAGSFVALALGVMLVSSVTLALASTAGFAAPPSWFTKPDVVVSGQNSVSITSGTGKHEQTHSVRTPESRPVPADVVRQLSGLGAAMVVDYAAYASVPGAPGSALHPWAAAGLHDYTWVSGGPPRGPDQLVVTAPTRLRPGDRVTAQTAAGPRGFTVTGVISTTAQPASYGMAPVAASLAGGRIYAVALTASAGGPPGALATRVAAVTWGQDLQVLTGNGRQEAEPDPDAGLLKVTAGLLGTIAGLAGFTAIFVVAGTFAYAVAVRRREFGLLRMAGARPRQVRRLVLSEALAVGVIASLAGDLLGTVIAGPGARWLARVGFAPAAFTARFMLWPLAVAFGSGLLIALAGAWLASRRAARVRPAEALRDAAVDTRVMTIGRWVTAVVAFAGSAPLIAVSGTIHSASAVALFLPESILLTLGFAMLTPVLAPPLTRLLTAPLAVLPGASGMLATHNTITGVRRTTAAVGPILLTLGIAGTLVASLGTLGQTQQAAAASRAAAAAIITPASGSGLADATVTAIRTAPGTRAAVPVTNTTVYVGHNGSPESWNARYVPGPDLPAVISTPVVAGRLAALTGTGTVAVPAGSWPLGQVITIWLADSAQVRLRVVALYADQVDLDHTMLLPLELRASHTAAPLATAVYLKLAPGTGPSAAARAAAAAGGGAITSTASFQSASSAQQNHFDNLALIAVLGMSIAYTSIAIANTLVMASAARRRELATLRLSGATRRQVLRMIALEACIITGIATILGGAVIATALIGLPASLASTAPSVHLDIPWLPVTLITLGCLVTAVLASLAPAAISLRQGAAELAQAGE
jgi:putative ABC transport system permease protein